MKRRPKSFTSTFAVVVIVLFGIVGLLVFQNREINDIALSPTTTSIKTLSPNSKISALFDSETRQLVSPIIINPESKEKYSFSVKISEGWEIERNQFSTNPGKLERDYIIDIGQFEHRLSIGAIGITHGIPCLYAKNDQEKQLLYQEEQYGEVYDYFTEIQTSLGELRISRIDEELHKDAGFVQFRVCEEDVDYGWLAESKIGLISFHVPVNYDQNLTDEMTTMVSDIKYTEH